MALERHKRRGLLGVTLVHRLLEDERVVGLDALVVLLRGANDREAEVLVELHRALVVRLKVPLRKSQKKQVRGKNEIYFCSAFSRIFNDFICKNTSRVLKVNLIKTNKKLELFEF